MNRIDWNALDETARREALARPAQSRADELRRGVEQIIAAVREKGDVASAVNSARIYRPNCTLDAIEVDEAEFTAAEASLDPALKAAIHEAAARIELFHRAAAPQPIGVDTAPGVRVERILRPGSAGLACTCRRARRRCRRPRLCSASRHRSPVAVRWCCVRRHAPTDPATRRCCMPHASPACTRYSSSVVRRRSRRWLHGTVRSVASCCDRRCSVLATPGSPRRSCRYPPIRMARRSTCRPGRPRCW